MYALCVTEIVRGVAMITSLVQISWSLCCWQRAKRRMTPGKRNMTKMGTILQFMWHALMIGSRVGAIVLFTSRYGFWIVPVAIGHWGIMSVWIMHQGTNFCDDPLTGTCRPCQEYMLDMMIGAIYLICLIPVKDEATRYKYTAFYSITFSENALLALSWYVCLHEQVWYQVPALVWVFGSFGLGLFFMLLYYRYFHPNGKLLRVNRTASCC